MVDSLGSSWFMCFLVWLSGAPCIALQSNFSTIVALISLDHTLVIMSWIHLLYPPMKSAFQGVLNNQISAYAGSGWVIFCRTISSSDRQDTPERTEVPNVFVAAKRFPAGNRGWLGPVSLIEGRCPQGHEPNREKHGFHSAVAFPKYKMQNPISQPQNIIPMGPTKWTKPHKSITSHWGIGKPAERQRSKWW